MIDWLNESSNIHRLNFSLKTKIDEGLKNAWKGCFPISLVKVKGKRGLLGYSCNEV
jgi:hypothetical protein